MGKKTNPEEELLHRISQQVEKVEELQDQLQKKEFTFELLVDWNKEINSYCEELEFLTQNLPTFSEDYQILSESAWQVFLSMSFLKMKELRVKLRSNLSKIKKKEGEPSDSVVESCQQKEGNHLSERLEYLSEQIDIYNNTWLFLKQGLRSQLSLLCLINNLKNLSDEMNEYLRFCNEGESEPLVYLIQRTNQLIFEIKENSK